MSDEVKEINIIELLLKISNDVSSIKTDMINFKETQKSDKESIAKEIAGMRSDCECDIKELNNNVNDKLQTLQNKLQTLQSVQNTLVGDVDTLKHAEEKKEAKRYRTVIAFVITALGGMILAKLPDFIIYLIKIKG